MEHSRKVAVVGAGLGGLATACTLAARGYSVTVLERNEWMGGKAALLEAEGFRFDMGPTILTVPSVLKRIYAEAGRRLEDHLELIPLDPQWRCFYEDGGVLDLCANAEQMRRNVTEAAGADAWTQYQRFLELAEKQHSISEKYFFWKPIGSMMDTLDPSSTFNITVLREILSMRLGKTVSGTIQSFIDDHKVGQMLDHYTQYIGSAPDQSPAILCAIAHMQNSEGVWYPRGGTQGVVRALVRLATDLGVTFRGRSGVQRVETRDGRVTGVTTEAGETLNFDTVVANSDVVRTHREMIEDEVVTRRFDSRRKYEPACSGVVLCLGLRSRYEHILHHNFVFSRDPEEEFDSIYRKGEPAPDPTCYVCAPGLTDPTVAPPGGEALYILVHTPYLRPHHNWGTMLPAYRKVIFEKLARCAGMEDLEERIVWESALTPQDINDRYSVLNGAIYGLASHGRFMGAFKPSNRSSDVRGLYFSGGSVHPGPGMPMVMMSAGSQQMRSIAISAHLGRGQRMHKQSAGKPHVSPLAFHLFSAYTRMYLRRNFHSLRVVRGSWTGPPADAPLIVCMNHPAWWDPLVALTLASTTFPDRTHYAPIDSAALGRYRIFERLGFFGIEPNTVSGAAQFLRTSQAILADSTSALWVTAEGTFRDPRIRPVRLRRESGI